MPLWFVQVAPVDVRAKLSIRGIIRITLSAFSIIEKVGTEGEQGLGARPLDLGARCRRKLVGSLPWGIPT